MNSLTAMPPAGPTPTPPAGVTDVFISYSRADGDWVASDLEPWLKENGYRVYRDDQILGGENAVEWIRNKIESSRYVVVVLSPSWGEREWTNYEAIVVQHADPLGKRKRLVPLLYKPCEIPKSISPFLQYIDLTMPDPRLRSKAMVRLIESLPKDTGTAGPVADPSKRAIVRSRLSDLANELRSAEGGRKFQDFKAKLETARAQIGRITEFKVLHDYLHQLADPCRMVRGPCQVLTAWRPKPPDESGSAPQPPAEVEAAWLVLKREAQSLLDGLEDLITEASRVSFAESEMVWIGRLKAARSRFEAAVRDHDIAKLRMAMPVILGEIDGKFYSYNTRLFEAAETLNLGMLMKSLDEVYSLLQSFRAFNPDDTASNWLSRLARLREELAEVGPTWATLVWNHNHLQAIDNLLKISFDDTTWEDVDLFLLDWQPVAEELSVLRPLDGDPRLARLRSTAVLVEDAVKERNPKRLQEVFETTFRGRLSQVFDKTDQGLRDLCPKVEEAGRDLESVLELIRDV